MSFKIILSGLFAILSFVIMSGSPAVWGEDLRLQEGKPFTDRDLEKYKKTADNSRSNGVERQSRPDNMDEKLEKVKNKLEQEKWCKKATAYGKKIGFAKEEIQDAEKGLSDEGNSDLTAESKKKKARERAKKKAQAAIARAEKKLKRAEKDLSDLEAEAHRKGIPPGWLRCQSW